MIVNIYEVRNRKLFEQKKGNYVLTFFHEFGAVQHD